MSIKFTPYTVFGWNMHRSDLPAGESINSVFKQGGPRESANSVYYYVKGSAMSANVADPMMQPPQPKAGSLSQTWGDIVAGEYLVTAQSDVEIWCANRALNRLALPDWTAFNLAESEQTELAPGKYLLCRGQITVGDAPAIVGPIAFILTAPKPVSAGLDSFILRFAAARWEA